MKTMTRVFTESSSGALRPQAGEGAARRTDQLRGLDGTFFYLLKKRKFLK
jgi:hypothetical protein